jgi:hypothetical protein
MTLAVLFNGIVKGKCGAARLVPPRGTSTPEVQFPRNTGAHFPGKNGAFLRPHSKRQSVASLLAARAI